MTGPDRSLTGVSAYEMLQRPELNEFGSITAYMYASDFQRANRPEIEHLPTLEQIEAMVRRDHVRADIVFVDPWHTYDDSLRVLRLAYDMLTPGGYLVVHACNPDQPEYTVSLPESCHACWCGETWRAFLDFTANLPESTEWWVLSSDADARRGSRCTVADPLRRKSSHRRHAAGSSRAGDGFGPTISASPE